MTELCEDEPLAVALSEDTNEPESMEAELGSNEGEAFLLTWQFTSFELLFRPENCITNVKNYSTFFMYLTKNNETE